MRKKQPQPSGDEILSVLRTRGQMATYVIRNWLSAGYPHLKTANVMYRMRKLEAMGRVRQVPTSYATMITWAIVE